MSKADRIAGRLTVLEAEYRTKLVNALRECAAGRWGLFGHNDHVIQRSAVAPVVEELTDLGSEIELMRRQLDLGPFALHERFLASRGPAFPNAPGEPRKAQAWLSELGELGEKQNARNQI